MRFILGLPAELYLSSLLRESYILRRIKVKIIFSFCLCNIFSYSILFLSFSVFCKSMIAWLKSWKCTSRTVSYKRTKNRTTIWMKPVTKAGTIYNCLRILLIMWKPIWNWILILRRFQPNCMFGWTQLLTQKVFRVKLVFAFLFILIFTLLSVFTSNLDFKKQT